MLINCNHLIPDPMGPGRKTESKTIKKVFPLRNAPTKSNFLIFFVCVFAGVYARVQDSTSTLYTETEKKELY